MLAVQPLRSPAPLRWLVDRVANHPVDFSLHHFYGLCHALDAVAWGPMHADIWKAFGRIASTLPLAALSTHRIRVLKFILRKHGALPIRYMTNASAEASFEESLPAVGRTQLVGRIDVAYAKALGGARLSAQETAAFFVQCANQSGELSNRQLLRLVYLLVANRCRRTDVLYPIWQAVNRRISGLPASDVCRLFQHFAVLAGRELKIIRPLSITLIQRCEEFVAADSVHALRGLYAVGTETFVRGLFDVVFRKFMEEANEVEKVAFADVILLFDTAARHAINLPRHFVHALVRYAGRSIREENIPHNIINCFVRFMRGGVAKPHELLPFTREMHVTVRVMNIAGVLAMLDACATLDAPIIDLILGLLERAVDLVPDASFQQCVKILSFLSKLVGSEGHPVICAISRRMYELSDMLTPEEAIEVAQFLVQLNCQDHSVRLRLACIIAHRQTNDLATATTVAIICLQANCFNTPLMDFYTHTARSVMSSCTVKDLLIIYQTLVALRIDAPELQKRILGSLSDHMGKRIKLNRQLPWHLIQSVKDFQAAAMRG